MIAKKYTPSEIEKKWPSFAKASEGQARYEPNKIEKKWQEKWKEEGIYKFKLDSKRKTYYPLVELPYSSGDLHIGHWFSFGTADVHARVHRMMGENVFFTNGYDAFGLPAENAAIKRGVHPKDWTMKNIETMTRQFGTMGSMIDWSHTTAACLPEYYKWNQWIFIRLYEKGLAYRGKMLSNWCPVDQTVLANEHVIDGKCWRCGATVIQKEIEQWFIKLTALADELIWPNPAETVVVDKSKKPTASTIDWPLSVKIAQNQWIGRSEGFKIEFKIQSFNQDKIEVFTTRPETTDGASFIAIAPEHPLVSELRFSQNAVMNYVSNSLLKLEQERLVDAKEKTGVDTGYKAINPVNGKEIPIFIADYVLGSYGTGAIMGVPFADARDREFAKVHNLPVAETSFHAKPEGKKTINYHIRDWSISRQRYWGTPVPMIHCKKDGIVPVPDEELPVELPYDVDYTPKGKAPLASNEKWMKVKCPKCGGEATRDPETLDTFFDSSWYFWRYLEPHFDKGPFDIELAKKIMPVDIYFGGAEHTLGHTLYARFFTKFFKMIGLTDLEEFAWKRVQHGVILGPDGHRMSKSRGNVINPDDVVKEFGADATRMYLCFMMPYDATAPWDPNGLWGVYRFLKRVWELQAVVSHQSQVVSKGPTTNDQRLTTKDLVIMNRTIKKVGEDASSTKFNTAVSELMKWLNHLEEKKEVSSEEYKNFLLILAPFAPHIAEELYQRINDKGSMVKKEKSNLSFSTHPSSFVSIHQQAWPKYDEKYLIEEQIVIAVQINGKMRGIIEIASEEIKNKDKVIEMAKSSPNISKHLEGNSAKNIVYVPGRILNFVV